MLSPFKSKILYIALCIFFDFCQVYIENWLWTSDLGSLTTGLKVSESKKQDIFYYNLFLSKHLLSFDPQNKETDESWDIFIIWNMNSRLVWAAGPYLWKKSLGPIMSNFRDPFFTFSLAKNKFKFFWKYCSVRTEKLHRIKVKKSKQFWEVFFTGEKPFF